MPVFRCVLERKVQKRINPDSLEQQLEYIVSRGTAGDRKNWENKSYKPHAPTQFDGGWLYRVALTFERKGSKVPATDVLNSELASVINYLHSSGTSTKFKPNTWSVTGIHADWTGAQIPTPTNPDEAIQSESEDVIDFDEALTLEELEIPEVLVCGSDEEIEDHPAFKGLFARARHIRIIAASLKRMKETKGKVRNHILLWGLPGCGKSHLLKGWRQVLGPGGSITINSNSATRAGVEKIFFRLRDVGCPPVCFAEEMEKTLEAILTVWLSILDERGEIRKITHFDQNRVAAEVLCLGTANDKLLFDRLHGGRPGHPGALSSRFSKQLYVPRPDSQVMAKILAREIELYGGSMKWIAPCLEIAQELKTNDPRIVLSFLDGQERLMDGSYKDDIIEVFRTQEKEMSLTFDERE